MSVREFKIELLSLIAAVWKWNRGEERQEEIEDRCAKLSDAYQDALNGKGK